MSRAFIEFLKNVVPEENTNSVVVENKIKPIILSDNGKLKKAFARLLQALFFSAIMHFTKEG